MITTILIPVFFILHGVVTTLLGCLFSWLSCRWMKPTGGTMKRWIASLVFAIIAICISLFAADLIADILIGSHSAWLTVPAWLVISKFILLFTEKKKQDDETQENKDVKIIDVK